MVGIKKIFAIIGIIIPFFAIFLMSENTFAATIGFDFFSFYYNTPQSQSYVYSGHKNYDAATFGIHAINRIAASSVSAGTVPTNANYMTVTAKFNLVTWTDNGYVGYLPESGSYNPTISDVAINGTAVNFESSNLNVYQTDFSCQPLNAGYTTNCRTFTYEYTFLVRNVSGTINSISFAASYSTVALNSGFRDGFNCYFEYDPNNKVIVDYSYDYSSALMQQQVQLQTITNNNLTQLNENFNEFNEEQNEAYDNISGQSTSDINGSTDQQTTNIIGVISTFLSTITNIQATNCRMRLQFPEFAGGSQLVDICQNKDKFSGLVSLGSNLMLILLFVPLAWILLRMIYNEIRSWTNG